MVVIAVAAVSFWSQFGVESAHQIIYGLVTQYFVAETHTQFTATDKYDLMLI